MASTSSCPTLYPTDERRLSSRLPGKPPAPLGAGCSQHTYHSSGDTTNTPHHEYNLLQQCSLHQTEITCQGSRREELQAPTVLSSSPSLLARAPEYSVPCSKARNSATGSAIVLKWSAHMVLYPTKTKEFGGRDIQ